MHPSISRAQPKFTAAIEHLRGELGSLRSGRATPALIEHVKVEVYGTTVPLVELASISAPEPRLLVISPWDKSVMKDIERALQVANLGMSPTVDSAVIRLNLPTLTEERRRELVKLVKAKIEESRVVVRNIREEIIKSLKELKTSGDLSEDEFFVSQKDLQKIVDEQNEHIKRLGDEKETEIMTL